MKHLVCLFFLGFITLNLNAVEEKFYPMNTSKQTTAKTNPLTGANYTTSQIVANTSIFHQTTPYTISVEDKFFNFNPSPTFISEKSKFEVTLKLVRPGQKYNANSTNALSYRLPIKVEAWKTNTSAPVVFYTSLSLFYSQANGTNKNQLVSTFTLDDYYKVNVSQVVSGTAPSISSASLMNDDIEIELNTVLTTNRVYHVHEIEANAIYEYVPHGFSGSNYQFNNEEGNVAKISISNVYPNGTSLGIGDPTDVIPEEYDLEWVFIDYNSQLAIPFQNQTNNQSTFSANISNLDLKFSRVTLKKQMSFHIPLIYSQGYIIYRIRPVTYSALGERIETSAWSYTNSNPPNSGNVTNNIFYVAPHQTNLNWTSSISFAEDGKRKSTVSYFDGTQRERQSIALNNTNNIAFISESYYDFEGRKAVSTLPAPKLKNSVINFNLQTNLSTPANSLQFYPGFNLNAQNMSIKEADFNRNPLNGCLPIASSPLSNSSGASQYYSSNNFLHNNSLIKNNYLNFWLPNANNYPYIQTKYTNDGTNRILTQSGVGDAHKLASGHETKYYYTNVNSQEELDRLFGTEIGNSEFYSKTYSEDPNGQVSVTYQDLKGNTIATALIGNKPAQLSGLNSSIANNTSDYVNISKIDYEFISDKKLNRDFSNQTISGLATHFVPISNEDIKFNFKFNTNTYNQNLCLNKPSACIDCYYDIDIQVSDNCGSKSIITKPDGSPTYVYSISNYNPNPTTDFVCNNSAQNIDINFNTYSLQKGSYQISAKAKVSESKADEYTRKYMAEMEKCVEYDIATILNSKLDASDPFNCLNSCKDCNDIIAKGKDPAYRDVIRKQLQKIKPQFSTEQLFENYVMDVTNKQWASLSSRCKEICDGQYLAECKTYKQALMKDVGLDGQYGFQITATGDKFIPTNSPSVLYAAIDNSAFLKTDGTTCTTVQEVMDNWQLDWAEKLIIYHPEHCYYEKCIANQTANMNIEKELNAAKNFDCNILSNYSNSLLSSISNSYINWATFKGQYDNFKFFSTNSNAVSRSVKEWAYVIAFSKNMNAADLDPALASSTKMYSINHFKANNCMPSYCQQDKDLFWTVYISLVRNLVGYYKNEGLKPVGNTVVGTAPSVGCYPNDYISCVSGSSNTSDVSKSKNLSSFGSIFDGLLSSNSNSTPSCNQYDNTVILKLKTGPGTSPFITFKGSDFNSKKRIFPNYKNCTNEMISKIENDLKGTDNGATTINQISEDTKKEMCENQALGWINQIENCIINKITIPSSAWSSEPSLDAKRKKLRQELMDNFVEICKVHCGETGYESGTKSIDATRSTASPVVVFGGVGGSFSNLKSFQDIIDKYTGGIVDPNCTADVISLPEYGNSNQLLQEDQVLVFSPKQQSCECDQIKMWKDKFTASGQANFYQYMIANDPLFESDVITEAELNLLVSGCASNDQNCRYLKTPITLPKSFMCKKYFTCYEVAILRDGFHKKYQNYNWGGLPTSSTVYQNALTGYFNTYKGTNLTYFDFKYFDENCKTCMGSDWVAKRNHYQTIYNNYASNPTNKFPNWAQDNLKKLAKHFGSLNDIDGNKIAVTNQNEMIKLICDYLIDTKKNKQDQFPCCMTDIYSEYVNKYPKKTNESYIVYYNNMRAYFNAKGKFNLSLNDIKSIFNNCGTITLYDYYTCCDLRTAWNQYNAFTKKQKAEISREDYINRVLGQSKKLSDFELEMNTCGLYSNAGFKNCAIASSSSCDPRFEMLNTILYKKLLFWGGTKDYSFDWNNITVDLLKNINDELIKNNFSPITDKDVSKIYFSKNCDRKDCAPITYFYNKFFVSTGNSNSNMPPHVFEDLIRYLVDKTGIGREDLINYLSTNGCGGISLDFCAKYKDIYKVHYKNYLTANPNFIMDWNTIPSDFVNYLNGNSPYTASLLSYTIDETDLLLIINQYRSCVIPNECAELLYFYDRFKTSNGYTTYIPPSELSTMLNYLSKFMNKTVTLQMLEDCPNGPDFCKMYMDIYVKYENYLNADKMFVMNWNPVSTAVLSDISTKVGRTVTADDLKFVYKNYRRCYISECDELRYHFNRYCASKGIPSTSFSVEHIARLFVYLNAHLGIDHPEDAAFWTKLLKDCNIVDICAMYKPITDAILNFHANHSDFEIDWNNMSMELLDEVRMLPGCLNATPDVLKDAFNNSYCFDKFDCQLISHYYDIYKNSNVYGGGNFLQNGNSSLTGLLIFLNDKFISDLTFKDWIDHLRRCQTDIDNYIVPCEGQRTCAINTLVEYDRLNKLELFNVETSIITSDVIHYINACVNNGYQYSSDDWRQLFTLCDFNDECFDYEVFAGRYVKVNRMDNNACNLQKFVEEYNLWKMGGLLPKDYNPRTDTILCFKLENICPMVLERLGLQTISCTNLKDNILQYICNRDPMAYMDRTKFPPVFMKGRYLEDLRDNLNSQFSTNLSICDYELLLESCDPCLLGDFFEYLSFEYLYFISNGAKYTHVGQSGYLHNPCKNPETFFSKKIGGGYVVNGQYVKIVETIQPIYSTMINDLTMSDGVTIVQFFTKHCEDDCSTQSMNPSHSGLPKPCDKSDCERIIAAWEAANADWVDFGGGDSEENFDTWWDFIYWHMIHDLFDGSDYWTPEELKLKLTCCGIKVHKDLNCDELLAYYNEYKSKLGEIRDNYKDAKDDNDVLRDWMNDHTGKDETTDFWISFLRDLCGFLDKTPDIPCEKVKFLLKSDKDNPYSVDIWGDMDVIAHVDHLSIQDVILTFQRCLNCEEFLDYFMNSPQFKDILIRFYVGAYPVPTPQLADIFDFYLDLFGCELDADKKSEYINRWYRKYHDISVSDKDKPAMRPEAPPAIPNDAKSTSSRLVKPYPKANTQKWTPSAPSKSMKAIPMASPEAPEAPSSSLSGGFGQYASVFNFNMNWNDYKCCKICEDKLYDRGILTSKEKENPCQYRLDIAMSNAITERENILRELAIEFKKKYIQKCLSNATMSLTAQANDQEHHYTLYYYGQDGKLIQTVPPAGVKKLTKAQCLTAKNARLSGSFFAPNHTLQTKYWYNAAGQVVKQKTPDAGESIFVYDELGRLILSQNAKQFPTKASYTVYDRYGRIAESGEVFNPASTTANILTLNPAYYEPNGAGSYNKHYMKNCNFERYRLDYFPGFQFKHVMRTYYDKTQTTILPPNLSLIQENLNKRIVATTLDEDDQDHLPTTFSSALYYSYDILGNVKNFHTYTNNSLIAADERVKRLDYEFDLQSGKVNKVYYQKGKPDQYIHKYEYDAENRLTAAKTSFDDYIYNTEATYLYYLHGPLARTTLGENLVQGLDYVYTIHGWLKAVNGSTLDSKNELGQDGIYNDGALNSTVALGYKGGNNGNVARDAVSFSLDYYNSSVLGITQKDYSPIFGGAASNVYQASLPSSLYNGNIASQVLSGHFSTAGTPNMMRYEYGYDQLNRIVEMRPHTGTTLANFTPTGDYKEKIAYDPNGNILSYYRNKDGVGTTSPNPATANMDDLKYRYYYDRWDNINNTYVRTPYNPMTMTSLPIGSSTATYPVSISPTIDPTSGKSDKLTNQLAQVTDIVASSATLDIDNHSSTENFVYDKIGNLIEDKEEGLSISWNPVGKIDRIYNTKKNQCIEMKYDPMGQRSIKAVYNNATCTSGGMGNPQYTYYQRDAQGNNIATYNNQGVPYQGEQIYNYKLSEFYIYGSSRLGIKMPKFAKIIHTTNALSETNNFMNSYTISPAATESNYWEDNLRSASTGSLDLARLTRIYTGMSQYELPNHLGNVLATVKDEPTYDYQAANATYYVPKAYPIKPVILTATDYYPFGMPMPNRSYSLSSSKYRFGFNTQEKDDEVYGAGNLNTAEFWEYDTRIGRRWNIDPVDQIEISNYAVNGNNPILFNDPFGDNFKDANGKETKAGEGITASEDGKTIFNNPNGKNNTWDYGTWNPNKGEKGGYDLHSYNKVEDISKLGLPDSKPIKVDAFKGAMFYENGNYKYALYPQSTGDKNGTEYYVWMNKQWHLYQTQTNYDKANWDAKVKFYEYWGYGTMEVAMLGLGSGGTARTFSSKLLNYYPTMARLGLPTGRTVAVNLMEQAVMNHIKSNPSLAIEIMKNMGDKRWTGWSKMQYTVTSENGKKVVVHFVAKIEDGIIKFVNDFKFK